MWPAWGWGRGWGRGRGWFGPWPGRGPFSYLPPWQRPGWLFGRGAGWQFFGPWAQSMYGYPGAGYSIGTYGYPGAYGDPWVYRPAPYMMPQYPYVGYW